MTRRNLKNNGDIVPLQFAVPNINEVGETGTTVPEGTLGAGQLYWSQLDSCLKVFNGSTWEDVTSS